MVFTGTIANFEQPEKRRSNPSRLYAICDIEKIEITGLPDSLNGMCVTKEEQYDFVKVRNKRWRNTRRTGLLGAGACSRTRSV